MRTLRHMLVAAALVAAVLPAAAQADSIAYVKNGDVWLSTPDGARHFQVTSDGGYADVSQADDGTMIALHGVRLHKLDRLGNVLANFDTPVSDTRPPGSKVFWGPFDPAISPDGTKVAYWWIYMTQSQSPGCYPPTCYTTINEGGTAYSHSDRQTAWDEPGMRKHTGWMNPTWVDNQVTLLSDPTHLPNADVVVDAHAERDENGWLARNWFSDNVDGNPHVGGGDASRDRSKLAFQTGENDSTLSFYRVANFPTTFKDGNADPSTYPEVCYRYTGPNGGSFGVPTFSPDGARAAWHEADGIHLVDVPSFAAGCTLEGATPTAPLVIAGGSQPDWGPADVPASRPGGGSGNPGGGDPGSGPGNPGGGPVGGVTVSATAVRLRTALKRGLRITLAGAAPGKVAVKVKRRGKLVARGSGQAGADGSATVTARFTKAARRKLRRARKVKLTVLAAGASTKLTLRR